MEGGRPGRVHIVCVTLKVVLAALGGRRASLPVKATQTESPAAWTWVLPPQLSSGNVAPPTNLDPTGGRHRLRLWFTHCLSGQREPRAPLWPSLSLVSQ